MNRKDRRAMEKKMGKDQAKKLADKFLQFDQLPDTCLACTKPYDKTSKEMARTWNVVITAEDAVRLYCPECWTMALSVIEEYKKEIEDDGRKNNE